MLTVLCSAQLKTLYRLHRLPWKMSRHPRASGPVKALLRLVMFLRWMLGTVLEALCGNSNCDQWSCNCILRCPWIVCQLFNSTASQVNSGLLSVRCKHHVAYSAATFDLTGKKLSWQRCCLLLLLLPGFINQFSFIYNVLLIIKSGISYGLTKFSLGNTYRTAAYSSSHT